MNYRKIVLQHYIMKKILQRREATGIIFETQQIIILKITVIHFVLS